VCILLLLTLSQLLCVYCDTCHNTPHCAQQAHSRAFLDRRRALQAIEERRVTAAAEAAAALAAEAREDRQRAQLQRQEAELQRRQTAAAKREAKLQAAAAAGLQAAARGFLARRHLVRAAVSYP
jgi:IQ calmodulin-binding motif